MNNTDKIKELLNGGAKISHALKVVCGHQRIFIPYNEKSFDVSLEKLSLSTRSYNALRRAGLNTLNDVVNFFHRKGWNSIRNFGHTSAAELFAKFIDVAWDNMSDVQKTKFLASITK